MPTHLPALALSFLLLAVGAANAQMANAQTAMPMDHTGHHAGHHAGMSHGTAAMQAAPTMPGPTMPGQDAFGTIQEIVAILDADPHTDWTKVDIEALRRHLIDMNEVTLNAASAATPIDGGARFAVTGAGRTLDAIRRMVPAHAQAMAQAMNSTDGWTIATEALPDGVLLTVTSADARQAARIRGLGFIGIMVQGSHHQQHHLAMARGGFAH